MSRRKSVATKAAEADGRQKCGPDCSFGSKCYFLGILGKDICSAKFQEGYRKGYAQAMREVRTKYAKQNLI